jgi:hypothetical protein
MRRVDRELSELLEALGVADAKHVSILPGPPLFAGETAIRYRASSRLRLAGAREMPARDAEPQ